MRYSQCKFYQQKNITPWHSDVFDHPTYKSICNRDNLEKELIYPEGQCEKCQHFISKGPND